MKTTPNGVKVFNYVQSNIEDKRHALGFIEGVMYTGKITQNEYDELKIKIEKEFEK